MSANGGGPATDPSAALAEKLLQGWALLQDHCPQCLTPLVRNRQRKMYCVSCDQWILTQAEAAQKILQERVGEKEEDRRSSDLTTHVAPHPSPVVNSNHVENGQSEQSLPSDRIENSSALEAGYSSETLNLALSKISTILVKKLEELGDNLLRSHDVEATRSAMIAVRECLQTIADVKQLQI